MNEKLWKNQGVHFQNYSYLISQLLSALYRLDFQFITHQIKFFMNIDENTRKLEKNTEKLRGCTYKMIHI